MTNEQPTPNGADYTPDEAHFIGRLLIAASRAAATGCGIDFTPDQLRMLLACVTKSLDADPLPPHVRESALRIKERCLRDLGEAPQAGTH